MTPTAVFVGARVHDGLRFIPDHAVAVENGRITEVAPADHIESPHPRVDLGGDILCPPFVDLQVNGGGGVQFNDLPDEEGIASIQAAHARAGSGTIFLTLITDSPDVTRAAIDLVAETRVAGIGGLHLEGPHISKAKSGAHDPGRIRPMEDDDLDLLLDASKRLPGLIVTLAPEATTTAAIRALSKAGVVVSLGHTHASFNEAEDAFRAGASMATHLFNAMGPMHHRDPGVPGAALANAAVNVGLIADGLHVHPAVLRTAVLSKSASGESFLVTDAMAPFGTEMPSFQLMGRHVERDGRSLKLADGTLAGANSDLLSAVRLLVDDCTISPDLALRLATSAPARAAKLHPQDAGRLVAGSSCPLRISQDFSTLKPLLH